MTTRLARQLRQGAQDKPVAFSRGVCRRPPPSSAALALRSLPLVSWAALAQAVANRENARTLERRYGLMPGGVAAIAAGLQAQGIASREASSPWIPDHLPLPMDRFHAWALGRFQASTTDTATACREWAGAFPGLLLPTGQAADRHIARLESWLGMPGKPPPARRPLKAMLVYVREEGGPRYWHAMVALAHVRVVAIHRLDRGGQTGAVRSGGPA